MSQPPDQPSTPESPASPPTTPIEQSPQPPQSPPQTQPPQATQSPQATPPAQPTYAAQAQTAPAAPGPNARRSMWGEATSTRGGTLAVVLAGAGIGLVALLLAGLAAVFVAREVHDDRDGGPWAGDSREMPGPQGMNPGRGPGQLPPGQEKKGATDLPGLGTLGAGGALHGEAVIPGDGTATRTVVFQRGEVTAVTADKLTVKSTDGYSATYTIGADTRQRLQDKVSTLAAGDEVTVIATKEGNETLRILKTGRAGAGG